MFYKLKRITIVHEDCESQKEGLKQYMLDNFTHINFLVGVSTQEEVKKYLDELIV